MPFTEIQIKTLSGKLSARHVKTRQENGLTLSYVEGWHAITEANRVFGFDGWDRETMEARCVWQGRSHGRSACAYVARVRVSIRAGDELVIREGSGAGNGIGPTPGEAHESAIKEAETDAMKRALVTFGNIFGLALYDKNQAGVRQVRSVSDDQFAGKPAYWTVFSSTGEPLSQHADPAAYCSTLRKQLESVDDPSTLSALWTRNQSTVAQLQSQLPDLKSEKGQHYAEILNSLFTTRQQTLASRTGAAVDGAVRTSSRSAAAALRKPGTTTKKSCSAGPAKSELKKATSTPLQKGPRQVRDKQHLKYGASMNCMVWGRYPSPAHHIRFAQPRAMGKKVSDEWVVPLCALHHRALHDYGNEPNWWQEQKLDPIKEALRLWGRSHPQKQAG